MRQCMVYEDTHDRAQIGKGYFHGFYTVLSISTDYERDGHRHVNPEVSGSGRIYAVVEMEDGTVLQVRLRCISFIGSPTLTKEEVRS